MENFESRSNRAETHGTTGFNPAAHMVQHNEGVNKHKTLKAPTVGVRPLAVNLTPEEQKALRQPEGFRDGLHIIIHAARKAA